MAEAATTPARTSSPGSCRATSASWLLGCRLAVAHPRNRRRAPPRPAAGSTGSSSRSGPCAEFGAIPVGEPFVTPHSEQVGAEHQRSAAPRPRSSSRSPPRPGSAVETRSSSSSTDNPGEVDGASRRRPASVPERAGPPRPPSGKGGQPSGGSTATLSVAGSSTMSSAWAREGPTRSNPVGELRAASADSDTTRSSGLTSAW